MTEFDLQAARRTLADSTRKRDEERDALYRQATSDAAAIVKMLTEKYGPKRIWQWGSLLRPKDFTEHADIDIAVEGIHGAAALFALYGDARKLTAFPLDLVELDKIEPEFADLIRMKGRVVYERP